MRYVKCRHCGAENDANAKTCDDCGKYLTGSKSESKFDAMWGRCSWESDGIRCGNAGTLAEGTQGSDKWYCSGHYGCTSGVIGHQILTESLRNNHNPDFSLEARAKESLSQVEKSVPEVFRGWTIDEYRQYARKTIRSIGNKEPEGRYEWAQKIIDMHKRGEQIPFITLKIARERMAEKAA